MANVTEYERGTKPKTRRRASSRRKQPKSVWPRTADAPAPETAYEPGAEATTPAAAGLSLSELLQSRVRVTLSDGIRWMSGYDILSRQLRLRARSGEHGAGQLLERLKDFRAGIKVDPEVELGAAQQTEAEHELTKAFIKRTLERVAAQSRPGTLASRSGTPVADQESSSAPLRHGNAQNTGSNSGASAGQKQQVRRPKAASGKGRATRSTRGGGGSRARG